MAISIRRARSALASGDEASPRGPVLAAASLAACRGVVPPRPQSRRRIVPAVGLDGSTIQNAIYIAGESLLADDGAAMGGAAREALDDGPFGYIAGGAGTEATMRANREAFDRRPLRPKMLTGNVRRELGVEVLGRGRRRRSSWRRSASSRLRIPTGRSRSLGPQPTRDPAPALERGVTLDRGDRRGDGRRAALVPALLGERPRDRARASSSARRPPGTRRSW